MTVGVLFRGFLRAACMKNNVQSAKSCTENEREMSTVILVHKLSSSKGLYFLRFLKTGYFMAVCEVNPHTRATQEGNKVNEICITFAVVRVQILRNQATCHFQLKPA